MEDLNQFEKGMVKFLLSFSRPELRSIIYWIRREINKRSEERHDWSLSMERRFAKQYNLLDDHGLCDGFVALLGMGIGGVIPYGEKSSEDEDSDGYDYRDNPQREEKLSYENHEIPKEDDNREQRDLTELIDKMVSVLTKTNSTRKITRGMVKHTMKETRTEDGLPWSYIKKSDIKFHN